MERHVPAHHPAVANASFSTAAAAHLAGVTYRQADYWCRTGVLDPENNGAGSGSTERHARRWSVEDVALLRVCGRLAELNAGTDVMARTCAMLRLYPMVTWGGSIWVTADGQVWDEPPPRARSCWWVDLADVVRDLPIA